MRKEGGEQECAWQEGYAAFTASPTSRDGVKYYIANQAEHHRQKTFREEVDRAFGEGGNRIRRSIPRLTDEKERPRFRLDVFSPNHLASGDLERRGSTGLEAGGFTAISRWLSAATPPVGDPDRNGLHPGRDASADHRSAS